MLYDKNWEKTAPKIKPVKIAPWRQLLLKAARILERDGWCRGTMHRGYKSCARGALLLADDWSLEHPTAIRSNVYVEAEQRLKTFLSRHNWCAIESWNDAKGRTAAEVIATMRKVAGA